MNCVLTYKTVSNGQELCPWQVNKSPYRYNLSRPIRNSENANNKKFIKKSDVNSNNKCFYCFIGESLIFPLRSYQHMENVQTQTSEYAGECADYVSLYSAVYYGN